MPQALAAPAPGYRPRSSTNDLKEIVEDHLETLERVWDERFRPRFGSFHPRVKELLERFIRCGDPHFGFLRLRCTNADCPRKEERIVPLSCKSRGLCPSCGTKRAILWAERMVEEVLPSVPYAGLVFTIPKMLRKHFLWERSRLRGRAQCTVRGPLPVQAPSSVAFTLRGDEEVLRGPACAAERKTRREEVLKFMLKRERITPERVELLRSWKHSGFSRT